MGVLRRTRCLRQLLKVSATLALLGVATYSWSSFVFGDLDVFPATSPSFHDLSARRGTRDPLTLQDNPGGAGYLVYGIFDSGDYTNKKIQLVEALAMAAMSNRTLVVPWLCQSEPSTYLFDAAAMHSAVGIIEDTSPWVKNDNPYVHSVLLRHLCGTDAVQLKLPHGFVRRQDQFGVKPQGWRGVNWRLIESSSIAPDESLRIASAGDPAPSPLPPSQRFASPPYDVDFNADHAQSVLERSNMDSALLLKLRAPELASSKCLYIDTTYCSFDWGLTPRLWQQLHSSVLLPSASSARHAAEWMARNGLSHGAFVAVHVRQGDMLQWSEASRRCSSEQQFHGLYRDALVELMAAHNVSTDLPVAIATEDFSSPCIRAIESAFPRAVPVNLEGAPEKSCFAAQHIQEVMAHSAIFIGTGMSTFSTSIGWIRKYRHGFDPGTTRLLVR